MASVMDRKGFRYKSSPNLYKYEPSTMDIIRDANRQQMGGAKGVEPARDNRYPAFAAPMSDGRLITDYRTHCTQNIPVGAQYDTKHWMQNNAEQIMDVSRRRQMEWSGGSLPILELGPPPADVAVGTVDSYDVQPTNYVGGLGLVRPASGPTPDLFGSFHYAPGLAEERNNVSFIRGTVDFEGGRNSPRGRIERNVNSGPIHGFGTNHIVSRFAAVGNQEVKEQGRKYPF
jgi:hypothetical protein